MGFWKSLVQSMSNYRPLNTGRAGRLDGVRSTDDGLVNTMLNKNEDGLTAHPADSWLFRRAAKGREDDVKKEETLEKGDSLKERLKLRRGHGLSYAGLFLFTLVLYARPYEFESLSWLLGIAFWIALATVVIYIPTQLGLEGKLTLRSREVTLVLLLLVAALLSVPLATDPALAWNGFLDYTKVVLIFIVLVNVVRTEFRLKLLFLLMLVVSCVLSAAAFNDFRLGRLELGGQRIQGVIGGMSDNPNDLALHLVTIIPIAIALFLGSRAGIKKLFYAGCTILMTIGVVVTFSRGGFLGLVCMASVLTWRIAPRHKWLVIGLAPIMVVGFIVLAPSGYGTRLKTTTDGSAVARLDDLKRSAYVAIRNPLFGIGFGNYVLYSNKEKASHNAYTQVASELGIAALLFYVLFQIAPIRDLRRITKETTVGRRTSPYHYLASGLEASLIGYMVSSFFASVAFLWYLYFIVGYAVCLRRLYEASNEHVLPSDPNRSFAS